MIALNLNTRWLIRPTNKGMNRLIMTQNEIHQVNDN